MERATSGEVEEWKLWGVIKLIIYQFVVKMLSEIRQFLDCYEKEYPNVGIKRTWGQFSMWKAANYAIVTDCTEREK